MILRKNLNLWPLYPASENVPLLSRRRQMIPPDPKVMSDIDIDLQVFLTKKVENVVKGEQFLSDMGIELSSLPPMR